MKRRNFILQSMLGSAGLGLLSSSLAASNIHKSLKTSEMTQHKSNIFPLTIATWNFPNASKRAGELLAIGTTALDAVEQGVMVEEADIRNTTVGKGGAPDRDGNVTLDACIMSPSGDAGAVVYLKHTSHATSVARKVMEETPHVMLAGEGADLFAS
ncbi:MAG TPA: isoaspartyl peptidase/L-asparaginase, partial [Gillisia sp.]|nr:isoaspartyl peptidase/L-asparaginase [Gillisia sp.]